MRKAAATATYTVLWGEAKAPDVCIRDGWNKHHAGNEGSKNEFKYPVEPKATPSITAIIPMQTMRPTLTGGRS